MVRQVTPKRTPGWKAILAIAVAAGGLLWHMLACTESPMAFSPDGDLAFVTMEPYGTQDSNLSIVGAHDYRLMVLSKGKDLQVIEQTTSHLLTAPTYSPDGKHLCYLRIPLLTHEDSERLDKFIETRKKLREQRLKSNSDERWILPPAASEPEKSGERTASREDLTLPPIDDLYELLQQNHIDGQILIPVELIVRDAATSEIVSTVGFELPYVGRKNRKGEIGMVMTYPLTRPQYSADGQWVYFCLQNAVMAVNPTTAAQRVLAFPVMTALLSPDAKTIAVVQAKTLGFVQTDGQKALYMRQEDTPSPSGLAWMNNDTLAVLRDARSEQKHGEEVVLDFISPDGTLLRSEALSLPGQGEAFEAGELAIAPDGRHMAISFGPNVYFLKTTGEVLKSWQNEHDLLVQPTFTPDSTLVAFKYMKEDEKRAAAIVFFTPEGTEVSRVEIPKIEPGTIQPKPKPSPEPQSK